MTTVVTHCTGCGKCHHILCRPGHSGVFRCDCKTWNSFRIPDDVSKGDVVMACDYPTDMFRLSDGVEEWVDRLPLGRTIKVQTPSGRMVKVHVPSQETSTVIIL